ncbi:MAG: alpha-amylase [Arcobacter sp.]
MANDNNHKSNQENDNKGTSGTNIVYQEMLDNRSRQLNPKNSNFGHNKK